MRPSPPPPPRTLPAGHPDASDHVGRLAGGIAHDLNNLLTAVSGRIDLLRLELDPGDPRCAALDEIEDDVGTVARIVRKLVSYAGQAPTRRRTTSVRTLLEGLEGRVLSRREGAVRVLIRVEASPVRLEVDPGQMREVIDTLLDNALEAMPEGGVLLVQAESAGDSVRIGVSDNGVGMDPETLSRVFEPYFSTKPGRPGRGLEMAAARRLVRQNGGTLELESRPGRGTAATLRLPAVGAVN